MRIKIIRRKTSHGKTTAHLHGITKKERCANCGGADQLEWHHMIPAALGGTAEPENMVCLCKDCHEAVTAYQRKIMPEIMSKRRKTKI